MAKSQRPTLADIKGSPGFRAANPHLFPKSGSVVCGSLPPRAPGGSPRPPEPQKGIRTANKRKTGPERSMEAMLDRQKKEGGVAEYQFEGLTLSIGDGVRYTPDFTVWLPDGRLRFVETKGPYIREDSLIKWKVAKGKYPLADWQLWQLQKEGWTRIA